MNKTQLAEKLLLTHPVMRNYYLVRYEIYKHLNIPFDLFFNENILNYKKFIYSVKQHIHNTTVIYITVEFMNDDNNISNYKFLTGNFLDTNLYVENITVDHWTLNYYTHYYMFSIYQTEPFSDDICNIIKTPEFKKIIENIIRTVYNYHGEPHLPRVSTKEFFKHEPK